MNNWSQLKYLVQIFHGLIIAYVPVMSC